MLSKLLKYDLKYMIKNMSVFYILAIFFAILTRILLSLEQTVMLTIITNITLGCMFSMVASVIINVLMRSWVRFRDSLYKDEAYLIHTLPVTKNDIYNSKFLQALLFFIFSFIIVIICLFIVYYTKDRWIMIKELINKITTGLNFNPWLFIIGMLLVLFLELFNAIQCGFLGIILGYKKSNNKIGFSVLFGFIAYLLSQSLVLLLMYVVGLFNSSIMDLFNSNIMLDPGSFKLLAMVAIILYILIILIMNIICRKELNKGVNVE
jgi:hypothetical protein